MSEERYKNNPNPQMWFGLFFFGTAKGTRCIMVATSF